MLTRTEKGAALWLPDVDVCEIECKIECKIEYDV